MSAGAYLYLDNGKVKGPIDFAEVVRRIHSRQLGPLDQLSLAGTKKWRFLVDIEEFKSHIESVNLDHLTDDASEYIILLKAEGRKSWVQKGPYTGRQLRKWLQNGWLKYSDFAWTKGLKQWTRIGDLDDFQVKKVPVTFEEVYPGERAPDLATPPESEERAIPSAQSTAKARSGPEAPLENFSIENVSEEIEETGSEIEERLEPKAKRGASRDPLRRRWYKKLVFTSVLMAGMILVIATLSVRYHTSRSALEGKTVREKPKKLKVDRPNSPKRQVEISQSESNFEMESEPEVQAPSKVEAPAPPPPPPLPPKLKPRNARQVPSYLRILSRDLSTPKARIEIETDASYHYPVALVFKSQFGDTLEQSWVEKVIVRKRKAKSSGPWEVSLKSLNLPTGRYKVTATCDATAAASEIFVGKRDDQFALAMKRHLKAMAADIYNERRELHRAWSALSVWTEKCLNPSLPMAKNCKELVRAGKQAGKPRVDWSRGGSKKRSLLRPELWLEIGDIRSDLSRISGPDALAYLDAKKRLGLIQKAVLQFEL